MTTLGRDLIVGRQYIGDASSGDLDGMEFRLVRKGPEEHDMADPDPSFYSTTVEVGAETWTEIIIPSDATFEEVAD